MYMFEDLCILRIKYIIMIVHSVPQNLPHYMNMCREREHKITVGTMAGVFQKTAEQDVLEGLITSYFTDDLHSFVSEFHDLTREQVFDLEDNIMKKLTVSCALLPL